MSFSIDGLISGLNTSSIIDSMVKLQANQVNRLSEQKQQVVTAKPRSKGSRLACSRFVHRSAG